MSLTITPRARKYIKDSGTERGFADPALVIFEHVSRG